MAARPEVYTWHSAVAPCAGASGTLGADTLSADDAVLAFTETRTAPLVNAPDAYVAQGLRWQASGADLPLFTPVISTPTPPASPPPDGGWPTPYAWRLQAVPVSAGLFDFYASPPALPDVPAYDSGPVPVRWLPENPTLSPPFGGGAAAVPAAAQGSRWLWATSYGTLLGALNGALATAWGGFQDWLLAQLTGKIAAIVAQGAPVLKYNARRRRLEFVFDGTFPYAALYGWDVDGPFLNLFLGNAGAAGGTVAFRLLWNEALGRLIDGFPVWSPEPGWLTLQSPLTGGPTPDATSYAAAIAPLATNPALFYYNGPSLPLGLAGQLPLKGQVARRAAPLAALPGMPGSAGGSLDFEAADSSTVNYLSAPVGAWPALGLADFTVEWWQNLRAGVSATSNTILSAPNPNGGSVSFGPSSSYVHYATGAWGITSPNGMVPWTVEFFAYIPSANTVGDMTLFMVGPTAATSPLLIQLIGTGTTRELKGTIGGVYAFSVATSALYLIGPFYDTWHHFVFQNVDQLFQVWSDGVGAASAAFDIASVPSTVYVGATLSGGQLQGSITNLRVTSPNVYAVDNDFDVPGAPLPALPGTTLLLSAAVTAPLADSSAFHWASTVTGATPTWSSSSPFPAVAFQADILDPTPPSTDRQLELWVGATPGSGSGGSPGGSMTIGPAAPSYVDYPVGAWGATGDVTVEWWNNIPSSNTWAFGAIFSAGAGYPFATLLLQFMNASGPTDKVIQVYSGNADVVDIPYSGSGLFDSWHHVVVQVTSGTLYGFVDGVVVAAAAFPFNVPFAPVKVTVGDYNGVAPAQFGGAVTNLRISSTSVYPTGGFTPPIAPLTALPSTTLLLLASASGSVVADSSTNSWTPTVTGSVPWSSSTPFASAPPTGLLVPYNDPALFDTWVHVAVQRHGNALTIWYNGVNQDTFFDPSVTSTLVAAGVWVGGAGGPPQDNYARGTHLTNLRVTAASVYPTDGSAFTPPTQPLKASWQTSLLLKAASAATAFWDSSRFAWPVTVVSGGATPPTWDGGETPFNTEGASFTSNFPGWATLAEPIVGALPRGQAKPPPTAPIIVTGLDSGVPPFLAPPATVVPQETPGWLNGLSPVAYTVFETTIPVEASLDSSPAPGLGVGTLTAGTGGSVWGPTAELASHPEFMTRDLTGDAAAWRKTLTFFRLALPRWHAISDAAPLQRVTLNLFWVSRDTNARFPVSVLPAGSATVRWQLRARSDPATSAAAFDVHAVAAHSGRRIGHVFI